jgi:hypothetical protein
MMPSLPAIELWLAFWAGVSVGVVLGALIFSLFSIDGK